MGIPTWLMEFSDHDDNKINICLKKMAGVVIANKCTQLRQSSKAF